MLFPSILLTIFIFNISLINSQQQKQRITINQSQKSEPKVKGSVGVTILVKNGLAKQQGQLETDTPLTLWCQAVEISSANRRSPSAVLPVLPADEIYFTHNGKNHVANFSEASNYNGTLFINDVYIDHAGQWTCHVKTKEHGLVYGTITVYIRPVVLSNTRLRIYNIPDQNFQFEGSSITVIRGNDVHLTCPVYGNPRPQIVWMKGAQDLKDERMKVDNNGTLFIQNVTYLDQGMYTCKAVNTFADRFSSVNKKIQSTVSIERHLRIKSEFAWLLPLGIIILLVFLLLFIIVLCEMRKRRKEQKQLISVNSGADDD